MPLFRLFYAVICLIGLISLPAFAALQVDVSVDRNPVIMNESFNLIITANEDLPNWAFDTSPLLKDFIVGATASEKSHSLVQGVMTQTTRWQVRLTAQSPGTYTIPSLNIQGYTTEPLDIEVIQATMSASGEQRPYFIQAELSNEQPYVREQLMYKVELYLQNNTALDSGTINAPEAANADIQMVTQNRERQEIINGQRYRVITQEYAITPQRSGELDIKGAVFNGISRTRSSRGLLGFGRPEQVTLHTPSIQLEVKPKPDNFPGTWFISEQVTLEETWDTERAVFPVGEPVTRTITLTAANVAAESLPEITLQWPESLRTYPERPQLTNAVKNGMHVAQARYTVVIIPSQAGTVTLPEVKLPWFNSRTESIEYAVLPEREFSIVSPPAGLASPQAVQLEEDTGAITELVRPEESSVVVSQPTQTPPWLPIAFAGMSLLWLVTLSVLVVALRKLKRARVSDDMPAHTVPIRARDALNQLKRACDKNDSTLAIQALNQWQKARVGSHGSLNNLKQAFPHDSLLLEQINLLESSLYSAQKQPWRHGKQLWTAIAHLHSRAHHGSAATAGLYPR
ncbi:hypothetical protein CWE15_01185 [Aliidiomarina taiwanensis]|uniref:DUF7939 domain-containing protein n=1 Tax=Aliidiomarina taiwanensis TaxID=946228 RepID=A0A432X943_9GAMM|nr:BatD family protein [Aliidiomarina taiwanensis]RUO43840.1 hypothetical protein CWE15_01185 [Aliidiomarina taiwanensis]